MTEEKTKVWRFHYTITTDRKPDETTLAIAKDRMRAVADELTLENFGEEEHVVSGIENA
jgi:hypothetical protein